VTVYYCYYYYLLKFFSSSNTNLQCAVTVLYCFGVNENRGVISKRVLEPIIIKLREEDKNRLYEYDGFK